MQTVRLPPLSDEKTRNRPNFVESMLLSRIGFLPEKGAEPVKVLVVDDEKFNLAIAKAVIEANVKTDGVVLCNKPELVMDMLAEESFDIILLDIIMPRINGIDLLKQIRGREEYRDIQIIMATGMADKESFRLCFENGANDYVTKPIDSTELSMRMRSAMRSRENVVRLREMARRLRCQYEELQQVTQQLATTQNSLIQTEKLASLGEIAAGVAHEINNPIGFVGSNLETLDKYLGKIRRMIDAYRCFAAFAADESTSRSFLAKALQELCDLEKKQNLDLVLDDFGPLIAESRDGVQRVTKIVQSLRNFARTGHENDMALYDLNQIIEESLLIMQNEIKYVAAVHKNLLPLPDISCDKGQISQIIVNILSNAAQALKGHRGHEMGNIFVETYLEEGFAVCKIADDGPGIPAENLTKIFDPFFTTKPVGSGTGLGLSIAYGIAQKHGGELTAESEVGKGAVFFLRLPCNAAADAAGTTKIHLCGW